MVDLMKDQIQIKELSKFWAKLLSPLFSLILPSIETSSPVQCVNGIAVQSYYPESGFN